MLAGVLVASALRGAPGVAHGPAGRDVVLRDADGGVAWTRSFRDALRPVKPRAYGTLGSCDQLGCDNRLMTGRCSSGRLRPAAAQRAMRCG